MGEGRSGVLEFALGLSTGGFLHHLSEASAEVKGFIGSMIGLGAIIEGVWKAMERGAELEHLSRRTGQSVHDLYALQRGFKAAGLASEEVSPALTMMERSLGGVSEMGEKTDDIFRRMGLRIDLLKQMSGQGAFTTIISALSKLDQNSAIKGGSSIFGRNEGANMVQLSRSTKEFAEGLQSAQRTASLFERDAQAFERFERTVENMKEALRSVYAQMADVVVAFTNAWSQGRVSELIAVSITSGFKAAFDVLPVLLTGMGTMLRNAFFSVGMSSAENILKERIAAGKDVEFNKRQLAMFQEQHGNMNAVSAQSDADFKHKLAVALEQAKVDLAPLAALMKEMNGANKEEKKKAERPASLSETEPYKPEFTSLEKMGFVMQGLGNPMMNDIRANTKRTADLLATYLQRFSKLTDGPSLNFDPSNLSHQIA